MDIAQLRQEYTKEGLSRQNLKADPFEQFELWFRQAIQQQLPEANAMTLATVSQTGQPSVRAVLMKYFDREGFVFFTNYESRKAREMETNAQVALLFLWLPLERQVRIEGKAEKISLAESLNYFATRPRGSQIGAWCSQQSQVISSRKLLEMKWEEIKQKFEGGKIPLPSFWGGYRVVPHFFEFWQGRPNRLHDRFGYVLEEKGRWDIQRLAP
jgi:pyridoxamine 5'-phosphate oxidase